MSSGFFSREAPVTKKTKPQNPTPSGTPRQPWEEARTVKVPPSQLSLVIEATRREEDDEPPFFLSDSDPTVPNGKVQAPRVPLPITALPPAPPAAMPEAPEWEDEGGASRTRVWVIASAVVALALISLTVGLLRRSKPGARPGVVTAPQAQAGVVKAPPVETATAAPMTAAPLQPSTSPTPATVAVARAPTVAPAPEPAPAPAPAPASKPVEVKTEALSAAAPKPVSEWTLPGTYDVGGSYPSVTSPRRLLPLVKKALKACGGAVVLVGHSCDIGQEEARFRVGLERAQAMQRRLIHLGLSADSLKVLSKGATAPVSRNDSPAGRAKNRRVTVQCP